MEIKELDGKLFASIAAFIRNNEVLENELIPRAELKTPFGDIVKRFDQRLEAYRFLTYGRLVALSVAELEKPEVFAAAHAKLRHLIVDESQDINPAQEALIERLAKPPVQLCVVGDDDQSIYQWRGSDVANIVSFKERYNNVASFKLLTNRRSRPTIIAQANAFAGTISGRLPKTMKQHRPDAEPEMVT